MRKYFLFILLLVVIAFALNTSPVVTASTVPDKILTTRVVVADEVVSTSGKFLIHSFKVYAATAANASAGLYNCSTLGTATNSTLKTENGEATQYNVSVSDSVGNYPIELDSGMTVIVNNGYALIQYE